MKRLYLKPDRRTLRRLEEVRSGGQPRHVQLVAHSLTNRTACGIEKGPRFLRPNPLNRHTSHGLLTLLFTFLIWTVLKSVREQSPQSKCVR